MRQAKNRRLMGQMNVVPYIDVMLVLLIIFMITAPLMQQGIKVELPEANAAVLDPEDLQENESLILSIDADGNFYINVGVDDPEQPVSADTVLETVAAIVRRNPRTPTMINADRSISHGTFVQGLVLLQQAGATQIGIMTEPPEFEGN
jgi:biopolymer transport protein TolR